MQTHAVAFIQDLAIVMLIAGSITIICHQLKQPVVLGYIIAGMIIGPYTPPTSFIHDLESIKTLAELGIIFLMFSLGLEFNLVKLKRVGISSFIAAFAEIILMMWLGYEIGRIFGWSYLDAVFLGAILSISSTTIIVKALEELGMKKMKYANLIYGILIIEDIFAIIILALLSGLAIRGSLNISDVLITGIKLSSFLVFSLVIGILLIPKFLTYVAKFNSKEMLLISVLALCLGFCLLVIKLEYSVALGAFIIGAIIAESTELITIEKLIVPIRDMFSAIFFVTVGLLFDPRVVVQYFLPIIIITFAVIIGKILSCSLGVFLTGRDARTSMHVGMGLAQIGEFSFIIASLGITLNVTSQFLFPIAVAVSAVTTFLTPYLIKHSNNITKWLNGVIPNKISATFKWYTTWLQNIQIKKMNTMLKKIVRGSLIQIFINLFIIIAIFLAGAYIAGGHKILLAINLAIQKTFVWSVALILSLPSLIAIYRKIKALSMLLAELTVKKSIDQKYTLSIRKILSEIIPVISMIGILLLVFALSASILPPFELFIIAASVIVIMIIFLYSWLIKLHSKLQIYFLESLKKD